MNNIKLITKDEDIILFENKREEVFGGNKKTDTIERTTFGKDIKEGELLAFGLYLDKKLIGGALTSVNKNTLFINRLFIDKKNRSKGYGSLLLKYIENRKSLFEDYYCTEINEILAEPIQSSLNLFYKNEYDFCGDKVYKMI